MVSPKEHVTKEKRKRGDPLPGDKSAEIFLRVRFKTCRQGLDKSYLQKKHHRGGQKEKTGQTP